MPFELNQFGTPVSYSQGGVILGYSGESESAARARLGGGSKRKPFHDEAKKKFDIEEQHYKIIALWIIGTYFHKQFATYPYLFFNAPKSSGKSRLLKLVASLSWNGRYLISISEAVLFRTASKRTFCIDEFERVGSKEI